VCAERPSDTDSKEFRERAKEKEKEKERKEEKRCLWCTVYLNVVRLKLYRSDIV
jgi:hypothetical protein